MFKIICCAAAVFCMGFAATAQQPICAPREIVIERLSSKYGETRVSVGLTSSGGVVETFANSKSGTWTVLVTGPSGVSCVVSGGEAFNAFPQGEPA